MKRIVLYLLLSLTANVAFSQITLEKKYMANENVSLVNLEDFGTKFTVLKKERSQNGKSINASITLYNTDHSIFKNISLPLFEAGKNKTVNSINIWNISTKLFNSDDAIDFLISVSYTDTCTTCLPIKNKNYSNTKVLSENGAILLTVDSAYVINFNNSISVWGSQYIGIDKVDSKYKLLLMSTRISDGAIADGFSLVGVPMVYSLPGTLPDITTSLNAQDLDKAKAHLSLPMPNPSQDITRIEYELPAEVNFGEITVYNSVGFKLKSYKVDNTFGDLLLNNQDLATGNYYYQLVAGGKRVGSQKMLVIK